MIPDGDTLGQRIRDARQARQDAAFRSIGQPPLVIFRCIACGKKIEQSGVFRSAPGLVVVVMSDLGGRRPAAEKVKLAEMKAAGKQKLARAVGSSKSVNVIMLDDRRQFIVQCRCSARERLFDWAELQRAMKDGKTEVRV